MADSGKVGIGGAPRRRDGQESPRMQQANSQLERVWRHPRGVSCREVTELIRQLNLEVVPHLSNSPLWQRGLGSERAPFRRVLKIVVILQEILNHVPSDEEWEALETFLRVVREESLSLSPDERNISAVRSVGGSQAVSLSLEQLGAAQHWFLRHMITNPLACFRRNNDMGGVLPSVIRAYLDIGIREAERQTELHKASAQQALDESLSAELLNVSCKVCSSAVVEPPTTLVNVFLTREADTDLVLENSETEPDDHRRCTLRVHAHDKTGSALKVAAEHFNRRWSGDTPSLRRAFRFEECSVLGREGPHDSGDCCWIGDEERWEVICVGAVIKVLLQIDYIEISIGALATDLGEHLDRLARAKFSVQTLACSSRAPSGIQKPQPAQSVLQSIQDWSGVLNWIVPAEENARAFRALLEESFRHRNAVQASGRFVQKAAAGLNVFRQLRVLCLRNPPIPGSDNFFHNPDEKDRADRMTPLSLCLQTLHESCRQSNELCETMAMSILSARQVGHADNAKRPLSVAGLRAHFLLLKLLEGICRQEDTLRRFTGGNVDSPSGIAPWILGQLFSPYNCPSWADQQQHSFDRLLISLQNRFFDAIAGELAAHAQQLADSKTGSGLHSKSLASITKLRTEILWLFVESNGKAPVYSNCQNLIRMVQRHIDLGRFFNCFPVTASALKIG